LLDGLLLSEITEMAPTLLVYFNTKNNSLQTSGFPIKLFSPLPPPPAPPKNYMQATYLLWLLLFGLRLRKRWSL
jgi:hypothetical protein